MPEFLTLVYIRDVYFNDRSLYRPNGILKRNGCMRVSSGVQHNSIATGLFVIRLGNRLETAAVVMQSSQDVTDTQLDTGLEILQAGYAADFR